MSGHAERSHRRYSPSKAERVFACPGSVRQVESVPARPPSVWSIEGQKGHVVLEAALVNGVRTAKEAHKDYSFLCMEELDVSTGGEYKNFYFSIDVALKYVYAILDAHPDAGLWTETYVSPPSEVADGDTGGYCDVAVYIPSEQRLIVIDYKHGAGVTKQVYGNKQALQYGGGFLYDPNSPVRGADIKIVTLVIIQPRAYHEDGDTREYDVTPYEIQEYLDQLDDAIRASQADDAPLIPEDLTDPNGSRQCQFCDAAPTCPAREAKALAAVNVQFRTVRDIKAPGIPAPENMELAQLEYAAMHLGTLRKWADDVEKRLFELAQQGFPLENHKIVEAKARRKWYGEVSDLSRKLAELIGCEPEEVVEKKLINITDAEKLVVNAYKNRAPYGKKRDAAVDGKHALAFLTLKESTGNLTLVTNDDPRPAVDRATVAFKQIGGLLPGDATVIGDDD